METAADLPRVTAAALFAAFRDLASQGDTPSAIADLLPFVSDEDVAEMLSTALEVTKPDERAVLASMLLPRLNPEQLRLVRDGLPERLSTFATLVVLENQLPVLPPEGRAEALRRLLAILRRNPPYFANYMSSLVDKLTPRELHLAAEELCAVATPDQYTQMLALIGRHLDDDWRDRLLQACREIADGNLRAVTLHALVVNDLDPSRLGEAEQIARDIPDLGGRIRAYSNLYEFLPAHRQQVVLDEATEALVATGADDSIAGIGLGGLAPHFTTAQASRLFEAFRPNWNGFVTGYWLSCLAPNLTLEVRRRALAMAEGLEPRARVSALKGLVPALPIDLQERALAGIYRRSEEDGYQLADIAPTIARLADELVAAFVDFSLARPEPHRGAGITHLVARLDPIRFEAALDLAVATVTGDSWAGVPLLTKLYPHASATQRGRIAAVHTEIDGPAERCDFLLTILELSADTDNGLRRAALNAAATIRDAATRSRRLTQVAQLFTGPERESVLARSLQSALAADRSERGLALAELTQVVIGELTPPPR